MRTYTVIDTREDNQWVAVAGGLPAGVVGAMDFEHFSDVRDGMVEVIADLTGSEPDDFTIEWRYEVNGADVTFHLCGLLDTTTQLRRAQREQEHRVEGERGTKSASTTPQPCPPP